MFQKMLVAKTNSDLFDVKRRGAPLTFALARLPLRRIAHLLCACTAMFVADAAFACWDACSVVPTKDGGTPQKACEAVGILRSGHAVPYRLAWLREGGDAGGFYRAGFEVPGPALPNPENNYQPFSPSQPYCILGEQTVCPLDYYKHPSCDVVPEKTITIDPGHGGTKCKAKGTQTGGDTGTTGPTYKDTEHALALSIGLSLRDKLTSKGYKVVMTRTTAECPPLERRVQIAIDAKADLFVSIHFNGVVNQNANGTEAHTLKVNTPGWQIATSASAKVSSVLGTMNRGPKATNFEVLRSKKFPSTLVEVAFLSNVGGDEDIMHRPASVVDAASAIASSVDAFFNK